MSKPTEIEQQFGFIYPAIYHQLYADGMLDWGTAGPFWITDQYPMLRQNPPLLLNANDFELSNFKDISLQMEEFADPAYWMNIKIGLQFIPFAQNGAGDMYCFFPSGQQDDDIPIILLWHDANRAEYKAKNLQDFIFRSMLEAVADIEAAAYGLLQQDHFKEDLQHFFRTHALYLNTKQQQVIKEIYQQPNTNKPLISEAQLQEILAKEIGFEKLDREFTYQND